MIEKVMPQSFEAEQDVLGGCLIDGSIVGEVSQIVQPDDFYRASHRIIFESMLTIFNSMAEINLITLSEELIRRGKWQDIGAGDYLTALIESCASSVMAIQHAKIVRDKADLRRLIQTGEQIAARAYSEPQNAAQHSEKAMSELFALARQESTGGLSPIAGDIRAAINRLAERQKSPGKIYGISTGLLDLDELTGGLHAAQMTILAARPGQGKTALALQVAAHVAENYGPVAFISLEMSREQLADRLLSQVASVDGSAMARGYLDKSETARVHAAARKFISLPLYLDDEPALSIPQMLIRARHMAMQHAPKLIVVDYLQLAKSGAKNENRVLEIAEIGRGLCEIAKQFACPVLALAQLSRAVEQREDKRPMLSDLRESGSIEADAAVVQFIYRPGYYSKEPSDTRAEIIVAKNRTGATGTAHVQFFAEQTRFVNAAPQGYESNAEYYERQAA